MKKKKIIASICIALLLIPFIWFTASCRSVDGVVGIMEKVDRVWFGDEIARTAIRFLPRKSEPYDGNKDLSRVEAVIFSMNFEGSWDIQFKTSINIWAHMKGYVENPDYEKLGHAFNSLNRNDSK